jgi:hypothetical protein
MATRDSKVGITLEATNRASGAIEQVKKGLSGLDGAAGLATKGMAGLAGAFTAGAVISFAQNIGGAVVQMAQLAGQSQLVAGSMQGLAASFGQSADGMLDALKRASNGTIAEYDLMLGANKAMMLGVAQNADQLEGIMRVALSRGAAMGLSTTQAFDNLVTGLGRGSALILDNLGITMDSLRVAEESYAASVGKTTEALTDQEKKQAMVNAVLKEAESVDLSNVDGMAQSFAQAQAAWTDLKAGLGDLFGPAIAEAAKVLAAGVRALDEAADSLVAAPPPLAQQVEDSAALVNVLRENWRALKDDLPEEELARVYDLQERMEFGGLGLDGVPLELQQYVIALDSVTRAELALIRVREQASIAPKIEAAAGAYPAASDVAAYSSAAREAAVAQEQLAEQQRVLNQWLIPGTEAWRQHTVGMAIAEAQSERTAEAMQRVADVQANLLSGKANELAAAYPAAADGAAQLASHLDVAAQVTSTAEQIAASLVERLGPSGAAGEVANITQLLYTQVGAWEAEGIPIGFITNVLLPDYAAKLVGINAQLGAAMASTAQLGAMIDALSGAYPSSNAGNSALELAGQYEGQLNSIAAGTVTLLGEQGTLGWLDKNNQALYEQIAAWQAAGYEMEYITGVLAPNFLNGLRSDVTEMNKIEGLTAKGQTNLGGMAKGMSAVEQAAKSAYNSLKGSVEGILGGALNLDVLGGDAGKKMEELLPREDAVNENARRLADIMVNGFKDQSWLEEFKTEVPDVFAALAESGNPQQAAAQMLQNFQDGLLPGLIDKEAVKEKVKRAIIGDANMAALAAEITAELAAELGQNPAQLGGLVNQAMGRGTADSDINGEVLTQLKSQNFLNGVNKAGYDAGVNWGASFLTNVGENVPAQLLDMLATLVAPLVRQKNAAAAGQEGAQ